MKRFRLAPAVLALIVLAGCGKTDEANVSKAEGSTAAVAAPAGTTWAEKIVATDEGVQMGNPDAAIKVIEYGSYTCPHCRDFNAESQAPLEKDYVNTGKISFEYRNLVRDPVDITVALIAHCGGPEMFFPLSAQLFANQEPMITALQAVGDAGYKAAMAAPAEQRFIKLAEAAGLIEFAKQRGLPEDKVRACLADPKQAARLAKITEESSSKYNITGTPSFLLNGTLLDNTATWAALQAKLRDAGA